MRAGRAALALALLLGALAALAPPAAAHEMRPAYLELRQTGPEHYDLRFKVPARPGGLRLGLAVRLPPEAEVVRAPLGRFVDDAHLESWSVRVPGGLAGRTVVVDGLAATLTDVLVRVEDLEGRVVARRLGPGTPELVVPESPGPWARARAFTSLGFEHILEGPDHLLFVLGLLLVVRGLWNVLKTVTAFTVAHSLTLAAATLGWARLPAAPLEAAIALSILFLGPEIVRRWREEDAGQGASDTLTLRRPWAVAFAFGLLHGFGFANALAELGLPEADVVPGLFWFNVGVELGQVAFVLAALGLARVLLAVRPRWPLVLRRLPGYAVGSCGAWWTLDRVAALAGA